MFPICLSAAGGKSVALLGPCSLCRPPPSAAAPSLRTVKRRRGYGGHCLTREDSATFGDEKAYGVAYIDQPDSYPLPDDYQFCAPVNDVQESELGGIPVWKFRGTVMRVHDGSREVEIDIYTTREACGPRTLDLGNAHREKYKRNCESHGQSGQDPRWPPSRSRPAAVSRPTPSAAPCIATAADFSRRRARSDHWAPVTPHKAPPL
jgi:hypothetical protein